MTSACIPRDQSQGHTGVSHGPSVCVWGCAHTAGGSALSGQGLPQRTSKAAKADSAGRSWCTQDSRGPGREVTSNRGMQPAGRGDCRGWGGDLCRKKWQELALHVSQAERVTSQLTKDSAEQVRLFHSISFPPTRLSCAGSCREGLEEGARKAGGRG